MQENKSAFDFGKEAFEQRKLELIEIVEASHVPSGSGGAYTDAYLEVAHEVAFNPEENSREFSGPASLLQNPLYDIKASKKVFGVEYESPFEALYASAYYTFISCCKFCIDVGVSLQDTFTSYPKEHPAVFLVPNWRELQLLIKNIKDENERILLWSECFKILQSIKGTLSENEIAQCRYFFMNTYGLNSKNAAVVAEADAECTKLEAAYTLFENKMYQQLGVMVVIEQENLLDFNSPEISTIGVIDNNPGKVAFLIEKIKNDVEYAFTGLLN
jgi:hypothetical protein